MSQKEIEIQIDTDGNVTAEAFGFQGQGCEEAMNFLLHGLGKQLSVKNKTEYNDIQNVSINQNIG